MLAALFLGFLVITAAGVAVLAARYVGRRVAVGLGVGLCGWFAYVGLLGYGGVAGNTTMRPPGVVLVVLPVVCFLILVVVRPAYTRAALGVPLWLLLAAQSFRVVVELFLHRLWIDGVVPRMLTFQGANVDIYVGGSALLIAWFCPRGRPYLRLAFAWNVLGLFALANVVVRSVLTAPGPFHRIDAEVPNRLMSAFPYLFVPAFFVPLAATLHVLAIRSIASDLKIRKSQ